MAQLAPPQLPPQFVLDSDGGGLNRLDLRLLQLWLTLLTVLITVWLITLGPIPGIIAAVTAKHVLVAILVMGLGVDSPREAEE
jgi:hypothetical protein